MKNIQIRYWKQEGSPHNLEAMMLPTNCIQGRVRFDANGTVFQDRIRLLQYRRLSNSEKRTNQCMHVNVWGNTLHKVYSENLT